MTTPGCLYVCATPIGNLEDITLRVLKVLGEVDVIAAEDTRHTRRLLTHFDVRTPLLSLHEHNETARARELVSRLRAGESIALVSDAGMPGISDPGFQLIRAVIEGDIPLTVLPGATAFATALVGSGLPTDRFMFEGFLPRSSRRRRAYLQELRDEPRTIIFYESPHRIRSALEDMAREFGEGRRACVARELTKTFEQWQRAPLGELAAAWKQTTPRGEYVIVVEGAGERAAASGKGEGEGGKGTTDQPTDTELIGYVLDRMASGADKKTAVLEVARRFGLPRRVVYRAAVAIDAGFGQADSLPED